MAASRISLSLTPAQLKELDRALKTLASVIPEMASMTPLERRRLKTMGRKDENFCRETLNAMERNPSLVNPALGLESARADLEALDQLRPRLQELQRVMEQYQDLAALLGSDVMATSLEAYGLLRVSGKAQGLTSLRQDLGTRFKSQGRRASGTTAPTENEEDSGNAA